MRPKEFDPDQIADAAMQVFWQHGYAATSIQDLVEGTGLSRSSLYNAFDSKHGLYMCALKRYQQMTTANIELLGQEAPALERVRRLLMKIVDNELQDDQRLGCLAANASLEMAGQDPVVAQWVAQNFKRIEAALEQVLRQGQEQGQVASQKNPRALASFVVCTIQGLRVLGKGSLPDERRQRLLDVVEVAVASLA
ncbi:TetR/AcrR family transcriptional regulator [Pseudomonas sp. MPFS]|uniref:TetR/AcrR family transcriptional regulator n=1 Tax=Pseudomonas sp. MPFS TaxID=2795724 RepID=UPI001F12C62A|nr:TetR/AcrR family transcriptional regulator [Pseudomonas sp. MPFS]UMZ14882.1 TetR/AcrR family transcriptional regulator [Pseudomonas sp. MPFS]